MRRSLSQTNESSAVSWTGRMSCRTDAVKLAGCSRVWVQRLERSVHQSLCECIGLTWLACARGHHRVKTTGILIKMWKSHGNLLEICLVGFVDTLSDLNVIVCDRQTDRQNCHAWTMATYSLAKESQTKTWSLCLFQTDASHKLLRRTVWNCEVIL